MEDGSLNGIHVFVCSLLPTKDKTHTKYIYHLHCSPSQSLLFMNLDSDLKTQHV